MITFKRSVLAAALGCSLIGTSAQAGFASFWFDPDGAGTGGAFRVEEFLDINALLRIQNTFTGPTSFNFQQYGRATVGAIDGLSFFDQGLDAGQTAAMGQVGLTLSGVGTGNLAGNLVFGVGSLYMYSPMYSNSIAKFDIVGGSGNIDAAGVPNGQSTLEAKAVSFDAGYFYKDNGGVQGVDLSTVDLSMVDYFGFTTTGLSLIANPTLSQRNAIANAFLPGNAEGDQGFVPNANGNVRPFGPTGPLSQLYVSGNGQLRVSQVPEPGSLALLGLGLVGLAAASRRKAVK